MHPQIVKLLTKAADKVAQLKEEFNNSFTDPELTAIASRVNGDLAKIDSFLRIQAGTPVTDNTVSGSNTVKTMFGKPVPQNKKQALADFDLNEDAIVPDAKNQAGLELKEKVATLYPQFSKLTSDEILDSLSDLEIRGVAKKAGLAVTEKNPKTLNSEFIAKIKEAIAKKEELEAAEASAKLSGEEKKEAEKEEENEASDDQKFDDLTLEYNQLEEEIKTAKENKVHHKTIEKMEKQSAEIVQQLADLQN